MNLLHRGLQRETYSDIAKTACTKSVKSLLETSCAQKTGQCKGDKMCKNLYWQITCIISISINVLLSKLWWKTTRSTLPLLSLFSVWTPNSPLFGFYDVLKWKLCSIFLCHAWHFGSIEMPMWGIFQIYNAHILFRAILTFQVTSHRVMSWCAAL